MGMYEEKVFPVPHFCPLPCFKLVQPEGARHKPPDSGSSVGTKVVPFPTD